ncbi:MAG TPA: hypothetical protein PLM75_08425, partial [bacterium]|nr:hypothetical protein [bacterium]
MTVDSNLLNANGSAVQSFTWRFKTSDKIVFPLSDYFYLFEDMKFVYFENYEFFPFYQYSATYRVREYTKLTDCDTFLYFANSTNYIRFRLKSDGLYIEKIVEKGQSFEFPIPVLLFPKVFEYKKNYITKYNQYQYITKITSYENGYFFNYKALRRLNIEINMPFQISNYKQKFNISFYERNGIYSFGFDGNNFKTLRAVIKNTDISFPTNNAGMNAENVFFVFNLNDYNQYYQIQISDNQSFDTIHWDTIVYNTNEIKVDTTYFPNSYYYYRIAAYYSEAPYHTELSDWSNAIKFYIYSDTTRFVSTPKYTAFTNYTYRYSASALSVPNSGKLMYSLIKAPNNMRINPHNGYIIWQIPNTVNAQNDSTQV